MARELLNLSTEAERDHVVIDGNKYALADIGDFNAVAIAEVRRRAKALTALQGREDITEEEAAAADQGLDSIFRVVLPDLPEELRAKLKPVMKAQVIEAFFLEAAAKRGAAASTSTSGSSPASSASTAATPAGG